MSPSISDEKDGPSYHSAFFFFFFIYYFFIWLHRVLVTTRGFFNLHCDMQDL